LNQKIIEKNRVNSLDLLRGIVMIVMALDHTRDFFHFDAFRHDPLDVNTTSFYLYFTRWVTHFCAPVFVFLAGASAYLQGLRKNKNELSAFLFKRGLWLVLIECFVITFSWTFDLSYHAIILQVIWAIGISMMILSVIIRLPYKIIFTLGLLIVFGHNIFDYIEFTHHGFFWDLFRNGNFATHPISSDHKLVIIYPFLPWLGLMMVGYCTGKIFSADFNSERRRKILFQSGIGLILIFVLLRFSNSYGNPFPWSVQPHSLFTFLSFMNVHKYPPSLLFLCITIGPALIFISIFERAKNKLTEIISVYGKVPFFYYVIHFYSLHVLCMILFISRGHAFNENTPPVFGIPFHFLIAGEGYSLKIVYLIWMLLVIALYPLCKAFGEYKMKSRKWWVSYL